MVTVDFGVSILVQKAVRIEMFAILSTRSGSVWFIIAGCGVLLVVIAVVLFARRGAAGGLQPEIGSSAMPALQHNQRVALCTEGKFGEMFIDNENHCLYTIADIEHMGTMRLEFSLLGCFDFSFVPAPSKTGEKSMFVSQTAIRRDVLMDVMAKVAALGRNWDKCWPAVYEAVMDKRKEYETTQVPSVQNTTLTFELPDSSEGEHGNTFTLSLKLDPFDGFWGVQFSLSGAVHDVYVLY